MNDSSFNPGDEFFNHGEVELDGKPVVIFERISFPTLNNNALVLLLDKVSKIPVGSIYFEQNPETNLYSVTLHKVTVSGFVNPTTEQETARITGSVFRLNNLGQIPLVLKDIFPELIQPERIIEEASTESIVTNDDNINILEMNIRSVESSNRLFRIIMDLESNMVVGCWIENKFYRRGSYREQGDLKNRLYIWEMPDGNIVKFRIVRTMLTDLQITV